MCSLIDITNKLLIEHLKDHDLYEENPSWIIKESIHGKRGVFATRNIDAGEIIYRDKPIIDGPRYGSDPSDICVICYKETNGRICKKGCGLLLCIDCDETSTKHSMECEQIVNWRGTKMEYFHPLLARCLCAIRSLFLDSKCKRLAHMLISHHNNKYHGLEVNDLKQLKFNINEEQENYMRLICSIMDANAFEVPVGNSRKSFSIRGLYPMGSLANHNCIPNVMHVFEDNQTMIVKAAVPIEKDQEIYVTYTRLIWSTISRSYHLLRTKHFHCKCFRCSDPTELGSYMSSFLCETCHGYLVSMEPLKASSSWICTRCNETIPAKKIGLLMSVLGARIKNFKDDDVEEKLDFIDKKLTKIVAPNNQVIVELKYNLIWILGHKVGYKYNGNVFHFVCLFRVLITYENKFYVYSCAL